MEILTREEYSSDSITRMVRSVTFFKNLATQDQSQLDLLLSVSEFVRLNKGEVLMSKGESADCLYFLLKGQVSVIPSVNSQTSNVLNAGEAVGTMSMVTGAKRSATVVAHTDVVLLSLAYEHCTDHKDYGLFNLDTKLMAYKMVIHHIRWALELNKMKQPQHELAAKIFKIPIYSGEKNTQNELLALHEQARLLAELLSEWNDSHGQELTSECANSEFNVTGLGAG